MLPISSSSSIFLTFSSKVIALFYSFCKIDFHARKKANIDKKSSGLYNKKGGVTVYQITRITDKDGVTKVGAEGMGCIGEAQMEEGCVLFHCRYNQRGDPCDRYIRTSLVKDWKKDQEIGRVVLETMNSIYYMKQVKSE